MVVRRYGVSLDDAAGRNPYRSPYAREIPLPAYAVRSYAGVEAVLSGYLAYTDLCFVTSLVRS